MRGQLDGELAGVAAPDVEHVAIGQTGHGVDHLAHALVPALRPFLGQRCLADVAIVSSAPAGAVLAELEMQEQAAIAKERAADPRPQRQHAL